MGKLLEELKRRKVFRVAAVYAVVAWVLIQVTDVVLPTFGAPDWVNQTVIFLFILGFLPTLIAAWAYEVTPEGIKPDTGMHTQGQVPVAQSQRLIYATFILLLLAVGFQAADRFLFSSANQTATITSNVATSASDSSLSRRFTINIGSTIPFGGAFTNAEIALSSDGSKLVYRVLRAETGEEYLYLKNLEQLGERLLLNGRANTPFFSDDGEWVAYSVADGSDLYKVSINGGVPQVVAESVRPATGGFWSADGTIFFASGSYQLTQVSANGGARESLSTNGVDANLSKSWPYLLPGGDALLYTVAPRENVTVGRIDLLVRSTGELKTIVQNGYNARYVPTGHVVFVRDATLWAVPFDAENLQITGPEQSVIQGIQTNAQRGPTLYAFSDDGLLVYLPGGETDRRALETSLIWVDREGNEEALTLERNYRRWAVSPDGARLAVAIDDVAGAADIWIYDLARNALNRLTFDEANDFRPLWTPDGNRVIFSSNRDGGGGGLWSQAADGTGVAERLLVGGDSPASPYTFTPDGTQLLYWAGSNIYSLTPGNEVPSQPVLQFEFETQRPDLSSDGRWLAYGSNETGRYEIYVRPFPNIEDGKWQISSAGGVSPKWSSDGLELFFARPQNSTDKGVWVAQRQTADTPEFNIPVRAFEGSEAVVSGENTFDISADGSRLLLRREIESEIEVTEVTLLVAVENWFEELKRLAPPDPQ